jgi:hypothetical protein
MYLTLGDPNPTKRYHRVGWLVLKPGVDANAAYERLQGSVKIMLPAYRNNNNNAAAAPETEGDDGAFEFDARIALHDYEPRTKLTAEIANTSARLRRDLVLVRRITERFDKEFGIKNPLDDILPIAPAVDDAQLEEHDAEEVKKSLDLLLTYLRRVYYYCHYCGRERADCAEEFLRRCGTHHYRRRVRPHVAQGLLFLSTQYLLT